MARIGIDIRSFGLGLTFALTALLAFGAAAGTRSHGPYQLSMAVNDTYVFFGRIDTQTGCIETWKYVTHSPDIVRAETRDILTEPNVPGRSR
jgi:hypothetical protein